MERAKNPNELVKKPAIAIQAAPAGSKQLPGHSVPTAQVWSKYIDSRMKQFGTR